jgi:hypothetical protein
MLDTAFNNKVSDNIEVEDKIYVNLDEVEQDDISEPVMNKIKDMVEFMPEETHHTDAVLEAISPEPTAPDHNDFETLTSGFKEMPVFEPVTNVTPNGSSEKKSLNDRVKSGGLAIGLNDKIAFIKHLFEGNATDYDRVISQLNTINTYSAAKDFIETMVKPDYNHWNTKEEFENRFMEIIEAKYN